MANYANLKTAIANVVKTNGNNEITGALLQQTLFAMVNSLGADCQFAGIATPTTNPGTPDQNVFYIASQAGSYSNFGGIQLGVNDVAILRWKGVWQKLNTNIANDNVKRFDNYNAVSRAAISFPEIHKVSIGNGNIYIRKGNVSVYAHNHAAQTYTFDGSQFLCYDYAGDTVAIKNQPGDTDLVLLWHDAMAGIGGGLLFGYYLAAEIERADPRNYDNFNAVSRATLTFSAVNVVTIGNGNIYIRKGNTVVDTINHSETTYTFTSSGMLCYNLVTRTLAQKSEPGDNDIILLWYDGTAGFRAGLLILEKVFGQGGGDAGAADNLNLVSRAKIEFPANNQVKIYPGNIYIRKGNEIAQTINIAQETTYTFSGSTMLCYNLTTHAIAQKAQPEDGDVVLLWFDGVVGFRAGLMYDEYLRLLADSTAIPPMDFVLPNKAEPGDPLQPMVHGATQYYPQNTAGLFKLASKNRLNFWENDVRPCLDGFVLAHNDDLSGYALDENGDPIPANTWLCSQKTVAQLKTLKVGILPNTTSLVPGFENEKILTFEEYIILAKAYNAVPVVELKFGATAQQVSDLYAICEKHGMEKRVIWNCYAARFVHANYIAALNPEAYLLFTFYPPDEQTDMKTNLETCATYLQHENHVLVSLPWDNWDDIVGGVNLLEYAHTLKLKPATWPTSNSTYVAQVKAGVCNMCSDMYFGLSDNVIYYLQEHNTELTT